MQRVRAMRIDHFEGAYGPTIWLDVDSSDDLASLHSIFRSLASGEVREIDLCAALTAQIENLGTLRLCLDESRRPPRKRLVKTRSYERPSTPGLNEPTSFVWSNSWSGWKRCAEIVSDLIERDHPGRRDLSAEGVGDAFVELSFRATSSAAANGSLLSAATRLGPVRERSGIGPRGATASKPRRARAARAWQGLEGSWWGRQPQV